MTPKYDIRNLVIDKGNIVAFINRRDSKKGELFTGTVSGFTKQMVRVEYQPRGYSEPVTSTFMPHNLVVVR